MINNLYIKATPTTAAVTWGSITGTLSSQTDLQSALNAKQATLVSGTNIKTLEGQSLLGSGNIDLTKSDVGLANVDNTSDLNKPISTATQTALNAKQDTLTLTTTGTSGAATLVGSTLNIPQYGGGASGGFYTPVPLGSGKFYTNIPIGASNNIVTISADVINLMPFIPSQSFTTSNIFINVSTLSAGVNARILLYSHSATNGLPDTKIYESANLDCSTTGIKTATTAQTFTAGTTYWLGVYSNGSVILTSVATTFQLTIGVSAVLGAYTNISRNVTFGSAPSTWGTTATLSQNSFPRIGLTIA